MPNSPHWLLSSPACRIEWRPSRWPRIGVGVLAILALGSLWTSEGPAWVCASASVGVVAYAAGIVRREACRAPIRLWLPGGGRPAELDGVTVAVRGLLRRGPLWVLRFDRAGGGAPVALAWWPDTLDRAGRRELALAVEALAAAPARPAMAP
jgi:toxin CptA